MICVKIKNGASRKAITLPLSKSAKMQVFSMSDFDFLLELDVFGSIITVHHKFKVLRIHKYDSTHPKIVHLASALNTLVI